MLNPELGIARKGLQANELPRVNDFDGVLKVDEFPKDEDLRLDTVYYSECDKETESPIYKSFFRDNVSNLIMCLSLYKQEEGQFGIDLNSLEYGLAPTGGLDFKQTCEVLVKLVKGIRGNGDEVNLISAETTYQNISVDDINKIKSELTLAGITEFPEGSSELTDLYEKVVGKSYKPASVQFSDTYRFARVKLFEKVMAKYLPGWKMELKYKKWISFRVPEEL